MANQMIALQARNPQLPDPARATTQMANMLNMASQQRAAQLQGERLRQEMEFARAGEERAAQTQTATIREKDQAFRVAGMTELRNRGVGILKSGSEEAYQLWLKQADAIDPDSAAVIRQISPTLGNGEALKFAIMKADEFINKNYATPVASVAVNDRTGQTYSVTAGGLDPRAEVIGEVAPRATPTAAAPAAAPSIPMRATQGANTTPQDLMNQGMDPRNIPSGMPTSRPISFNQSDMGGAGAVQMTPDVMSRIVDSAFETGVMAQVDFDQLLASQPPQNKQALVDSFQRANITLQADAPSLADSAMEQQPPMGANPVQTPQSQFADMRGPAPQSQTAGLRGAPPMEQTLAQSQGRTPFISRRESPAPGIYSVSPQDVAATSRATRPSKQELIDAELAKIEAVRAAGPAPATPQQKRARKTEVANAYTKTQALMDKAYNPKEGVIALASKIKALSADQKESITGYSGYIPSFRASSREADTLIGNLKGVVTGLGKDAAAASGAIGPMAVQEWKIVADMIAKLDLEGMTPRALDAQMDRIIEQVRSATNLAERVYDVQYGDDIKEYPDFKLRGAPPPRTKTPVVKGGSRISPDIEKILKSRGL
jgi:hypothetical protein